MQKVADVCDITRNLVWLLGSVPADRPRIQSRLLNGMCDVAINLSALTTCSALVTVASPGPSPSICSVLLLAGWFVPVTPHLSTCICVSVDICICWCLSPSLPPLPHPPHSVYLHLAPHLRILVMPSGSLLVWSCHLDSKGAASVIPGVSSAPLCHQLCYWHF